MLLHKYGNIRIFCVMFFFVYTETWLNTKYALSKFCQWEFPHLNGQAHNSTKHIHTHTHTHFHFSGKTTRTLNFSNILYQLWKCCIIETVHWQNACIWNAFTDSNSKFYYALVVTPKKNTKLVYFPRGFISIRAAAYSIYSVI